MTMDPAQAAMPDQPDEAAGRAYQLVAQSAAIAMQDATDALRNITTLATTAAGVAMAQFLASGDPASLELLGHARKMVDDAIADYARIGAASATILREFP